MYLHWVHGIHCHIENTVYVYANDVMKILQFAIRIKNNQMEHCPRLRHMISNIDCVRIGKDKRAPAEPFTMLTNSDLAELFHHMNYALECFESNQGCEYLKNWYNIIVQNLSDFVSHCIYIRPSFETEMNLQWLKEEDISTN